MLATAPFLLRLKKKTQRQIETPPFDPTLAGAVVRSVRDAVSSTYSAHTAVAIPLVTK